MLERMPTTYEAFDGRAAPEPHSTFFRVFVGKSAAFEGRKGLRYPDDFPDGTTILIVQTTEAVPWTKPAELEYAPRVALPRLDGFLPNTFQLAFADGSTMSMRNTVSEKTLRAAISRNGNDHADIRWSD
ncbi:MAG: hypothetical protein FJ271_25070 [Planctomycetes bacterium]|nr:hypothetical protein [Planctomycetota bacterium]